MISLSYFIIVCPEFAAIDPAVFAIFVNEAKEYVNVKVWGAKAKYALALFTAHLLKLKAPGSLSGAASSSKVGDLQRTYASPNSSDNLSNTTYGVLFVQLRKTLYITPFVA